MTNLNREGAGHVRDESRDYTRFPFLSVLIAALLAVALAGVLDGPRTASAHPLGNFTTNRLLIADLAESGVLSVEYVVDSAEIPTFQRIGDVDRDGDRVVSDTEAQAFLRKESPKLLGNIYVAIDGDRVPLSATGGSVELLEGQGGLQTMRVVIAATGTLPEGWQAGTKASIKDDNYPGQAGWRQIVVRPGAGIDLFRTSTALEDVTKGLTEYPQDLLKSPSAMSEAVFEFRSGTTTLAAPDRSTGSSVGRDEAQRSLGRFASLVDEQHLTPAFVAVALLLAMGWGAMHALGPGHGKTVVAAYLVGERGNGRHALYLGLIVTATHTISVFSLGLIALFAADIFDADDVYYWLSLASGVLVLVLGGSLLLSRGRTLLRGRKHVVHTHSHHEHAHDDHTDAAHEHGHSHSHDQAARRAILQGRSMVVEPPHEHLHEGGHRHDHQHGHSHVPTAPGWRGLVALGISGGLVPCPTALVVMLGAIAIDRAIYGLVLVTAFSLGLAGVLMGIGLLLVYGRHFLDRRASRLGFLRSGFAQRFIAVSPVLSALGILALGVMLTSRAML
jgi:ABC-type nickel/cobalt efflux system permease component RcnA